MKYGKVIRSWGLYYQYQHFIPEDRVQQLFSDLYGIQLATARLTGYNQVAFDALAPFEESVLSQVKSAAVKNLDETGFRVAGKTQWLHVASTKTATYYHVSPKRKSLIDGLLDTVVHDHWKSYYNLEGVEHGLCNQHHLRELKSLIEYEKEAWATGISRLLRVALRCRHFHGTNAHGNVLYTGVTNDLIRRVYEHKNKMVAGFTQKYNVGRLVYFEVCPDIMAAIAREKQIKGWSRKKKDDLLNALNSEWADFYPSLC